MNALFALALLVSSSWAGVVMPVESGVAPARPSAPVVPVLSPVGGSLGAPSLGGADLRGTLPLLPSPVPGLLGPAHHFMGETAAAAAASIRPEAAAAPSSPASARSTAQPGRALDRPALPGKPSPGAPSLALSRDRTTAGSSLDQGASASRSGAGEAAPNPFVETSVLDGARPEKAAGLGRSFFDQSDERDRGVLEDPSASARPAADAGLGAFEGGSARSVAGLRAPSAPAAFGAGRERTPGHASVSPEGETLHDAVASVPGGGASSGGGSAAVMFRSASPNGELARAGAADPRAVPPLPALGVPRPLALDLSPSGLIVRVRSALGGALAAAPAAVPAAAPPAPGPSTALLERGGLLEAFSVSRAVAESSSGALAPAVRSGAASPSASAPFAAFPTQAPLWWSLFLLPLFVVAVRGIL